MAKDLGYGDDIGGLVQGLGGKGVPGGVEIDGFKTQVCQNILKALLQCFWLVGVTLLRAKHHVMRVELGLAVG